MLKRTAFALILPLIVLGGCASHDPGDGSEPGTANEDRKPLGKADSSGSCEADGQSYCGGKSAGSCWCDEGCANYGDCCADVGSACALSSGPSISFASDWSETVNGELTKGAEVTIAYDPERLTKCRGTQGCYQQWAITAQYRVDGGPIENVVVAGNGASAEPRITLSHRGDLELWFQNTNRWGCVAYDSNLGANYHFDVN